MPLKYPDEWKFGAFKYEMPTEAHREFVRLVSMIAEGTERPKDIYEDFKSAFGDMSSSSDAGWAESDLSRAMANATENAARYVAAFYGGIEAVRGRGIAVPKTSKINKILADHEVPLAIQGQDLVLTGGDIEFGVAEDTAVQSATASVRGPVIGRGGFSVVYLITHKTELGEFDYATKVLEPSVFMQDKERAKNRFKREMKALSKLQHRGIVPFLEAGMDREQKPYILMPYIQGKDLREALSAAQPGIVLHVFDEILQALEFAHAQHVIHRDLKPQNILVRESDGQPIILDFGCAYLLDDLDDETLTTTLIGTSAYIPHEVHLNPKNRTTKQDVYACGVLLYEVIAGHLPRPNDYESIEALVDGYNGIDEVIQAALAPERERLGSAKDLREQLTSVARGLV